MRSLQSSGPAEVSRIATLEGQLSAALSETAEEISHTECLDCEQRAEIYTILQTMRCDTETHRTVVGRWVSELAGEA